MKSISVLLVRLKKQNQAKRSDTDLIPTFLQGQGLSESCFCTLTPLRETAKTPMSLPDPSGNQPLQLSSTESGYTSQPPCLLCSCNARLTLSGPQLVPSTAPSSFEWQVVPTVHHRVLHTFWESRERSMYFLNLLACFSNIHLFPQGILSMEAKMVHTLFPTQTCRAYTEY